MSPTSDLYNSSGNRVMGTEDRLKSLQTEYVALSTRYTDDHPSMVKIIGEIKALKKELGGNAGDSISTIAQSDNPAYLQLQTQLQAAETELASLKEMRVEIKSKIKDFENRLIQSPQVEREYLNLTRDYENALAKYQEVKAKQLEADLSESLERERKGERFSLIEPPLLPETPYKPNRIIILLLGFVLSFAGGFGNVALRESMDQTVYGTKGVAAITKAPPLAVIPYIESRENLQQKSVNGKLAIVGLMAALTVSLVSVHLFYKPLDVIWHIVLRKLGIDLGTA
jgi:capsule polysaccharide export protein KpsE/RkpR